MSKVIGICGVARSGKDTFYEALKHCCPKQTLHRRAFADALKEECQEFLLQHVGISPFTQDEHEKQLIRPFLVTYGTYLRRKIDPDCWIRIVENSINDSPGNEIFVITDLRYENELDWVKEKYGIVIHLSRSGIRPANQEEELNDPLLKKKATLQISLPTFKENYLEKCKQIIKKKIPNIPILN